jgi:hypothetical protein
MMGGLAIAAVVAAIVARGAAYHSRAARFGRRADEIESFAENVTAQIGCANWMMNGKTYSEFWDEARLNRRMKGEYERAAWRPWLPVQPISSQPK